MKVLPVKDYLNSIADDNVKTNRTKMFLYLLARTNLFTNSFKLDIYDMSVICEVPEDDVVSYAEELVSTKRIHKLGYNNNSSVYRFSTKMYVTTHELKEDEEYISLAELIPFSTFSVGKYYPISWIIQ